MKKLLAVIAASACAVVVVWCGVRIEHVNAAYPERHVYSYALGREATYSGQNSSGEHVDEGSIVLRAHGFRAVEYGELQKIAPEYEDALVEEGLASNMRAFLIELSMQNASNHEVRVHVRDWQLVSGAWANGL